jgi:phosphoribosylformimino-5-aminoimidazole carboxamide ribotide isomerase
MAQVRHWLKEGVRRVILGTAAVHDPDLVKQACREFPGQIIVGIDARNGRVAVSGWKQESNMNVTELAKMFEGAGVAAIIYTDISRDGTGKGINIEATNDLARAVSVPIIASGGAGSIEDLKAAKAALIPGVIVGRAFYDKTIDPAEALKVASA